MALEAVKAKLHEARSFLDEMRGQEQMAFGDKSQFDHFLSAFLSAGRSVDYRLRCECKATYPGWRDKWNAQHTSEDRLIELMHNIRASEVHARGSGRSAKSEQIKVGIGGSYSDKSGTLEIMGSPSPLMGGDMGATISKPLYIFNVFGTERPVTEVCNEYLTLLDQMVAQYEADHGL
jgi:hypothetical protein